MTDSTDAAAYDALDFQARQLRMIGERLNYVSALLPSPSIDWRGPAQQRFDEGVIELQRDLASARTVIDAAAQRTMTAASQMSARVG